MSWSLGFTLINALVIPAWALLLVLPKSPITKALSGSNRMKLSLSAMSSAIEALR